MYLHRSGKTQRIKKEARHFDTTGDSKTQIKVLGSKLFCVMGALQEAAECLGFCFRKLCAEFISCTSLPMYVHAYRSHTTENMAKNITFN